jgi:hypothetical protein
VALVLLNTASAVIRFVTTLEDETTVFYEKLAEKYPEGKETFLSFSKENRKNKVAVERAYYGVITDALEACFSFKDGIDSNEYSVNTNLPEDTSYSDAIKVALDIEGNIQKYYVDTASLSEGLMADVSIVFKMMAKKRANRMVKLREIRIS